MGVSGKYGVISIRGIGEEEPVFILRAQDKLSAPAIEMYKVLALSHGCDMASSLSSEIKRFLQWKGRKKLPD